MANTTNLSLGKLAGTEKLKTFPTVQAGNMDTIDTAFGAGFGVSGKPTVNAEINSLADGLAIMCNGNTHAAIPAGSFAYVRGHGSLSNGLYKNNTGSTIAANATLSGSNLTADTDGGLNSVYNTLNSNVTMSRINLMNTSDVSVSTGSVQGVAIRLVYNKYFVSVNFRIRLEDCNGRPSITINNIPNDCPEFYGYGSPTQMRFKNTGTYKNDISDPPYISHAKNATTATITLDNYIGEMISGAGYLVVTGHILY